MAKASVVTINHLEVTKKSITVLKKTFNVTDNVEAVKMAIDAMAEKSELESIFERHKGVKIKKFMIKKIIDTNIFIDRFSVPILHKEIFVTKGFVYLSSIVMMELMAGAHTKDTRTPIGELLAYHKRTGRIVVPTATAYEQAGEMLAKLQRTKGYNLKKCASIANDCLIAASARSIGAIVYTQNRKDFQAIKEVFDFHVTYISANVDELQIDKIT